MFQIFCCLGSLIVTVPLLRQAAACVLTQHSMLLWRATLTGGGLPQPLWRCAWPFLPAQFSEAGCVSCAGGAGHTVLSFVFVCVTQEEVDMACLPVLSAADLLELGVVEGGERQRVLTAAAALRSTPAPVVTPPRLCNRGDCASPAGASSSTVAPASSRGVSGTHAGGRCGGVGKVCNARLAAVPFTVLGTGLESQCVGYGPSAFTLVLRPGGTCTC